MTVSNKINIAGVMSGTSLDGLDIAVCNFEISNDKFNFNILKAETIQYDEYWIKTLSEAHTLNARDFMFLNNEYGRFIGKNVNEFLQKVDIKTDWIASHGHTIMHEPDNLMTVQIGNGASIVAESGIPCVTDFRNLDVCLGGQGAPLVPFGDFHLFNDFEACLNIGGFSNITVLNQNSPLAFDVCPANILLNHYSRKVGFNFDFNGQIAESGVVNASLLEDLDKIECLNSFPRKSMSREWVEIIINEIINPRNLDINDVLRTLVEFVAVQIVKVVDFYKLKNVLLSGGGAHNAFLVKRLMQNSEIEFILPDKKIIDFKEALIFAFLGYMRINNFDNVFSSITGASRDTCSGIIWK